MPETQTYQNHVRWYPLVHFVVFPLLLINLIWQIVRLYQEPSWDRTEGVVLAVALAILAFTARIQALKAQDRVIRLEERLRYENVLSPETCGRCSDLGTGQVIALRFARDEELQGLVDRVLAGELKTTKEIKLAIKNWRGDYLRV